MGAHKFLATAPKLHLLYANSSCLQTFFSLTYTYGVRLTFISLSPFLFRWRNFYRPALSAICALSILNHFVAHFRASLASFFISTHAKPHPKCVRSDANSDGRTITMKFMMTFRGFLEPRFSAGKCI
jgi:hypothetical protein